MASTPIRTLSRRSAALPTGAEREPTECEPPEDAEPSLGSFDRITDQTRAWRSGVHFLDAEQDDCDREDDDPDEEKQQPLEMTPSD